MSEQDNPHPEQAAPAEIERLFAAYQGKRLFDAITVAHQSGINLLHLQSSTQAQLLRDREIEYALGGNTSGANYDHSDVAIDAALEAGSALAFLATKSALRHLKTDEALTQLPPYAPFARRQLHLTNTIFEPGRIIDATQTALIGYLTFCHISTSGENIFLGLGVNPQGELFYCYIPYSGSRIRTLEEADPQEYGDTTLIPLTPAEAFEAAVRIKIYLDYLDGLPAAPKA